MYYLTFIFMSTRDSTKITQINDDHEKYALSPSPKVHNANGKLYHVSSGTTRDKDGRGRFDRPR